MRRTQAESAPGESPLPGGQWPHGLDSLLKDLCVLAAKLCAAPLAAVSFESGATVGLAGSDEARAQSLAAHAFKAGQPFFEMRDDPASHSLRFFAAMRIESHAGAPRALLRESPAGAPRALLRESPAGAPRALLRESHTGAPRALLWVAAPAPRADGLNASQQAMLAALARQAHRLLSLSGAVLAAGGLSEFADIVPQIVWRVRADNALNGPDYINRQWGEYTGADASAPGAWAAFLHPEDAARAAVRWKKAQNAGHDFETECRIRGKDGAYRWFIARAKPMQGPGGCITHWLGTCTDIHDLKQAEEALVLLTRELSHRIKNIFAVVGGLATLSARGNAQVQPFVHGFIDRLGALALAHEYVRPHMAETPAERTEQSLNGLLSVLLAPYQGEPGRFILDELDVPIGTHTATALALILHEQATNAVKYGALSTAQGAVTIRGARQGDRFVLTWSERGGPPITAVPTHKGFGTAMAARSASLQLGGTMTHAWNKEGLEMVLSLPHAQLAR